ncbi:MAG: hypothetical protein ABFC89_06105 [Methanospirillum sp.]
MLFIGFSGLCSDQAPDAALDQVVGDCTVEGIKPFQEVERDRSFYHPADTPEASAQWVL